MSRYRITESIEGLFESILSAAGVDLSALLALLGVVSGNVIDIEDEAVERNNDIALVTVLSGVGQNGVPTPVFNRADYQDANGVLHFRTICSTSHYIYFPQIAGSTLTMYLGANAQTDHSIYPPAVYNTFQIGFLGDASYHLKAPVSKLITDHEKVGR